MRGVGRWILEYLALVGVPVLGIMGVLVAGRHLEAATPIDGSWALQLAHPVSVSCLDPGSADKLVLRVQQSGKYIAARVRAANASTGVPLDGTLGDAELSLTTSDACNGSIEIHASVNQGSDGTVQLRGTVSDSACRGCESTSFVGTPLTTARTLIPEESR